MLVIEPIPSKLYSITINPGTLGEGKSNLPIPEQFRIVTLNQSVMPVSCQKNLLIASCQSIPGIQTKKKQTKTFFYKLKNQW